MATARSASARPMPLYSEAKYRALMPDSKLSGRRIEEILGVIRGFERVKSVSELTRLLGGR